MCNHEMLLITHLFGSQFFFSAIYQVRVGFAVVGGLSRAEALVTVVMVVSFTRCCLVAGSTIPLSIKG